MTRSTRQARLVRNINRGDPITAQYLNAITGVVNANTRYLHGPRKVPRIDAGTTVGDSSALDLAFTETGRTETATILTDSNGDTSSVNVVDSMTLTNSFGGILTLTFDN